MVFCLLWLGVGQLGAAAVAGEPSALASAVSPSSDGRVGGQQRQRHHGAGGGDAGGHVVGGVEAVEEGGAGGVVNGCRERWMAGVGQLGGGGERGADGCVRGPRDGGRQPGWGARS